LKLFFDENLSEKLPRHLASEYPDSSHPRLCGMAGASDQAIREHAIANGFIIATRDVDLPDLVKIKGPPPKVIWIQFHNPSTRVIVNALRINIEQIEAFAAEPSKALLIIRQLPPNP
jgi:predicted nuclease of predicted toxin-antitoxin system